jgi:hypothetical protein
LTDITIPHKFDCRWYQIPVWDALERGVKRIVCCWHRGAGKDLFALNYLIYKMLQSPPAVYLHCFPKYNQGKKAIWTSVHGTDDGGAMAYLDHIPEKLIKHKNSSDMRIELINGSVYCVMGIDGKNAVQARGMNPSFVILSEYAYMEAESWHTLEPRVSQNNGTALFLSTPNGQNHFYHLYNYAQANISKKHFASRLTIDDTKMLDVQHIEDLRREGVPEDFIQQEYFCSFTRGAEGSYYGKQIQAARDDNRICKLNIIPDIAVDTAWDIGIGDSTSIFFIQRTKSNNINVVHYYENQGEGLHHYLNYLSNWKEKKKVIFGSHFVPHDMRVKEFSSGELRIDTARRLGYEMQVVANHRVEEGIQAVRALLPSCNFDEKESKNGIKALDFYRKKWNDVLKVYYDEPLHDQYSHGADAFRYLAMGIKQYGSNSKLSTEWIKDKRKEYLGY